MKRSLFDAAPDTTAGEWIEELVRRPGVRVERIVSRGHASAPGFWYDQDETEWVAVLAGQARLAFEGRDAPVELAPGDCVEIPAHSRHRVEWTDPERDTVWLAIFYR